MKKLEHFVSFYERNYINGEKTRQEFGATQVNERNWWSVIVPHKKVLALEFFDRITEYDNNGKILWQSGKMHTEKWLVGNYMPLSEFLYKSRQPGEAITVTEADYRKRGIIGSVYHPEALLWQHVSSKEQAERVAPAEQLKYKEDVNAIFYMAMPPKGVSRFSHKIKLEYLKSPLLQTLKQHPADTLGKDLIKEIERKQEILDQNQTDYDNLVLETVLARRYSSQNLFVADKIAQNKLDEYAKLKKMEEDHLKTFDPLKLKVELELRKRYSVIKAQNDERNVEMDEEYGAIMQLIRNNEKRAQQDQG